MSFFPKLKLHLEVEEHLRGVFQNSELVSTLGVQEVERRFESLLVCLSHPPAFTTVRINTHLISVESAKQLLTDELEKQLKRKDLIIQHPELPDVLLVPVNGPRRDLERYSSEVIVGAQCGNAVLRGAHVFAPGILSAPKNMKVGDAVSVLSDIEGKCKRGAKDFLGSKIFIGNGTAKMSRSEIFCANGLVKGIGIWMTEPVYLSPSFDNLLPSFLFLQNLPSSTVSHVLGPTFGERILDMCAAPGGKTTHIAALMHDQGEVIALDKTPNKIQKIMESAEVLQLKSIKAFCFDSTKAIASSKSEVKPEGPPFLAESFDRILLDAPCSGMGQRPNMVYSWSLKEVKSYQPLQRKLLNVAVKLLKPGGTLVYSTCTITLAENEEQVAWVLESFPSLRLQQQVPHLGGEGMMGAGLSHEQLKLLQRFDPSEVALKNSCKPIHECSTEDMISLANKDTIGFFIAKFVKTDSASS
ncbi:tRNA (cytosine(72)-C(5))-methyltransferase NSUN6 [Protopterus annectens]|uniref:tRNA (cytosine(72)-C(5))-methyltransferase NSUN6 n=1 Tax=Protopterus annectens TaxID=7888 RepID=UPI001CF9B6AB|nr:tRNA (cytosine(72)-C(5))-methyltransferase NSUN6 [Protopterus annectens]